MRMRATATVCVCVFTWRCKGVQPCASLWVGVYPDD
jgi:hypothetical protein